MPVATTLPAKNVVIRYAPPPPTDEVEEGYQLLELPAEILKSLEKSKEPIRSVSTAFLVYEILECDSGCLLQSAA